MADPIEDDDIFELPGGDEKVRLPKEEGERADPKSVAGKPGVVPADESDDEVAPEDQLGKARRHARRLEKKFSQALKENAGLLTKLREHDEMLHRLTRSNLQSDLRSAQGSVSAAESRLVRARDDGDRQEELNAERDLARERSRLDTLERAVSSASEERPPAPTPEVEETVDPRLEVAKELADEWSRKHKWYGDADAIEDSEIVRAVSTAIANDPRNPIPIDDPDHFDELDRRLARRLPERYRPTRRIEAMTDDDDKPDVAGTRGTSRRTNPAASNGADELPASLTQQQLKVYTAMGFDWTKKEDQERIIGMQKQLDEERKDRRHG
jgi:hypothetical protein